MEEKQHIYNVNRKIEYCYVEGKVFKNNSNKIQKRNNIYIET